MKRIVMLAACAALAACGQEETPAPQAEKFDPASYAATQPDLLVSRCSEMGDAAGGGQRQIEARQACLYIAEKKILGPDCVKMAETGLQERMSGVAAAKCRFSLERGETEPDERRTELLANMDELRACLRSANACKRLHDENVITSGACNSHVYWSSVGATERTEIFTRDMARTECALELDLLQGVKSK